MLQPTVFRPRGVFTWEHWRDGKLLNKFDFNNGVTDGGIDDVLSSAFNDATGDRTGWAVGLVDASGFTAFATADTMASHAGWAESVAYSEANRVAWGPAVAASQAIANASPIEFNINAGVTLKGTFLCSDNTKGGATGILWATAQFASDQVLLLGDLVKVTYTVTGA